MGDKRRRHRGSANGSDPAPWRLAGTAAEGPTRLDKAPKRLKAKE